MQIDTTKQLAYEMRSIYECASSINYLREWKSTQAPNVQALIGLTIELLEKEYERLNEHYIAFTNQALKSRELNKT